MTTQRAYFDHAATAPLLPAARDAWLAATERAGNPGGLHTSSRRVKSLLEDARESVAANLGAHPTEVVFTFTATEADSVAVLGGSRLDPARPGVVISAIEHPGVAKAVDHLDDVRIAPVDAEGLMDRAALADLVDDTVGLVSVQLVNGEVGTIQPVAGVAELAHARGALAHTDAVQALVAPGLDFAGLGVDMATVAGHKIGAPIGIGALLVRRELTLKPLGTGAGQERGMASGTPSAALASAFAAALAHLSSTREQQLGRLREVRGRILGSVAQLADVRVNGPQEDGLQMPGILNLTFSGARADDVLFLLDQAGIDASAGSACRAGLHQPSDVLLAMGRSVEDASSSVRLSFGAEVTDAEVDLLVATLPGAVEQARRAHDPAR